MKRFGRYRRRYLFGGSGDKEGFPCRKGRKRRIKDEKGRTLRKVYEEAKTPYERLMDSEYLEEKEKEKLRRIYEGLNMVKLREEIDKLIEELINGRSKEREMKVNFRDKNMI